MLKHTMIMSAMTCALTLSSGLVMSADQDQTQQQEQEQVYGRDLMSKQEHDEHRSRMRAAKTAEEREQIRNEMRERMKKRANESGMTLPDNPPARGRGMGFGNRN